MSIEIATHRVVGVDYQTAPDHGGKLAAGEPRFIVLHYTAGAGFSGALSTLTSKDDVYASAHLLVGMDGRVAQLVPFDTVAYHAGSSAWKGFTGLNAHSIGIEMVNPGYARAGISYAGATLRAVHKNGGPARDWFLYPLVQVERVVELCAVLMQAYPSILEVVGHDDIAPGRKTDPGPAWDWDDFKARLALERGIT